MMPTTELGLFSAIILAGLVAGDKGNVNSMLLPSKAIELAKSLIIELNQIEK